MGQLRDGDLLPWTLCSLEADASSHWVTPPAYGSSEREKEPPSFPLLALALTSHISLGQPLSHVHHHHQLIYE